uniref:Uncharacterized LOC106949001 n=1 Tax=Poecilia latipinna TaxID=48699 RepID=A0A3B3UKD3_9TELE
CRLIFSQHRHSCIVRLEEGEYSKCTPSQSRRRSLIWRLFEHLDNLNAARCRICMKKLHKSGGISNLRRHLVKRHPKVLSELLSTNHRPAVPSQDVNVAGVSLEVRVEDDSSDVMTPSIEPDGSHIINDNPDSLQEGLAQDAFHSEAGENSSERPQTKDRRRSVIWRHFERLESSEAAQCRICMRKLQCYDSGCTGNLHRHLSKRHPKVFSELGSNSLKQLSPDSNERLCAKNTLNMFSRAYRCILMRPSFPSAGLKISRQPEVEVRVFERELELIEALRRTQREEAQALQQQRELLEKLQTVGAREAAAERETIESLRKAQQEEADELIRQREELEKEKVELRKKWEELYQEKEEFSLLSKNALTSGFVMCSM